MNEEQLAPEIATSFIEVGLRNTRSEFPNKPDHIITGIHDLQLPRALHPIFFGSYDWHSCVHNYWMLAYLYRTKTSLPLCREIANLFNASLTPSTVAQETMYIEQPVNRAFARPYGWAWLLMLCAELAQHHSEEGKAWLEALRPLGEAIASRFLEYLERAEYPVRAGTHINTAFSLTLASEYGRYFDQTTLGKRIEERARSWYLDDVLYQAWEPDGTDFLSPALIEAECMRRMLPAAQFISWFDKFLPNLHEGQPATLFRPVRVRDSNDPYLGHLHGLNLSRAWCWRSLSNGLPSSHPSKAIALQAAEHHLRSSVGFCTGDYMREHWMPTFAILALRP
jgi:hypothetical protein